MRDRRLARLRCGDAAALRGVSDKRCPEKQEHAPKSLDLKNAMRLNTYIGSRFWHPFGSGAEIMGAGTSVPMDG